MITRDGDFFLSHREKMIESAFETHLFSCVFFFSLTSFYHRLILFICAHVRLHVQMHTCTRAGRYAHTFAHVSTRVQFSHSSTHAHTYVHALAHTLTYAHCEVTLNNIQ